MNTTKVDEMIISSGQEKTFGDGTRPFGQTCIVESGGILNINGNCQFGYGNIDIQPGGTVNIAANCHVTSGKIRVDGNLNISGDPYLDVKSIEVTSAGNVNIGGISHFLGRIDVASGGRLTVGQDDQFLGQIYAHTGADVTISPKAAGILYLDKDNDDDKSVTVSGLEGALTGGTLTVGMTISNFHGDNHLTDIGWVGPADGIHLAGIKGSDVTGITFANDGRAVPYPDKDGEASDEAIIHLKGGGAVVLKIPDAAKIGGHIEIDSKGNAIYEPNGCFLRGTDILTPEGHQRVETLKVGDFIIAVHPENGEQQPRKIVWTGCSEVQVNVREAADLGEDQRGYAVCIKKGTFTPLVKAGFYPCYMVGGETAFKDIQIPSKDLYVTSEHCFLFQDFFSKAYKFLPIRMLVNGKSIFYDHDLLSYKYYHIETEEHSVIIANGVLSESYLDTGDRESFTHLTASSFRTGDLVLRKYQAESFSNPELGQQERLLRRQKGWGRAAAPLDTQRSFAENLWRSLAQYEVCFSSQERKSEIRQNRQKAQILQGISLECDQRTYLPCYCRGRFVCFKIDSDVVLKASGFVLNPDGKLSSSSMPIKLSDHIYLCSPTKRPCDVEGPFVDDRRHLGLLVGRITFAPEKGYLDTHLSAGSENLFGWNGLEPVSMRWTKGRAQLPLGLETHKVRQVLKEANLWQKTVILAIEVIENMAEKYMENRGNI